MHKADLRLIERKKNFIILNFFEFVKVFARIFKDVEKDDFNFREEKKIRAKFTLSSKYPVLFSLS